MSRRHSGNFRDKHPAGTKINETLRHQVGLSLTEGALTCQSAHAIATSLGFAPDQVGVAIDLINARIKACQLGLFGYGQSKRIAMNGPQIEAPVMSAIQEHLIDGRLTCAMAWSIADAQGVPRMEIGRACELLGVKIIQCQLGAF